MKYEIKISRYQKAFTLIEVMFAIIIVGIAIAAIIGSAGHFSAASSTVADTLTAEFLISQIITITATLPIIDPESGITTFGPEEGSLANYDDLDDFDDASYNPPIDSQRQQITDLSRFSQQITVQNVNPGNLTQTVSDHSSDFVRVTVSILLDGSPLTTTSWLRTMD